MSRNLPQVSDGVIEGRGGFWHVRPWRQVELGDLMSLYELQYANTTGTIVRSEEYWRWMIGRKYAHVIWVACQGEAVQGYAFIKDHKILEVASDPAHPQALRALLGRVRAEALERAYPEVTVHAPDNHPVIDAFRAASGRIIDQDSYEGSSSMYHIPDLGRFLNCILPELARRASESGGPLPVELGISLDDDRWLIHVDGRSFASRARQAQPSTLDSVPIGLGSTLDGTHGNCRRRGGGGFHRLHQHRAWTPPESSFRHNRSGGVRSTVQPPSGPSTLV